MIQLMKRLLEFSGKQRKNLIASFLITYPVSGERLAAFPCVRKNGWKSANI